jgi:hypothetical protein
MPNSKKSLYITKNEQEKIKELAKTVTDADMLELVLKHLKEVNTVTVKAIVKKILQKNNIVPTTNADRPNMVVLREANKPLVYRVGFFLSRPNSDKSLVTLTILEKCEVNNSVKKNGEEKNKGKYRLRLTEDLTKLIASKFESAGTPHHYPQILQSLQKPLDQAMVDSTNKMQKLLHFANYFLFTDWMYNTVVYQYGA